MSNVKRHRGVFNPNNSSPYELSRTRIENFIRCPCCFYLQQVKKVNFPSTPGFNINEATDVLLKRDFDECRAKGAPHPFLKAQGYGHLIPFDHEDFELWTQSLHFGAKGRFHTIHDETKLKVGGGLDDVWLNTDTGKLHIVDYKSTSLKTAGKNITLDDPWKSSYKRQMDLYVWVMRRKGFDVSDIGYFLYCDGDRFTSNSFLGSEKATMQFKMSILPYSARLGWIEPTLVAIQKTLNSKAVPRHNDYCEFGKFLKQVDNATGVL